MKYRKLFLNFLKVFSLTLKFEQISLPHKVDEDNGKAQFDKTKKVLIVTLPIVRPEPLDIPSLKPHLVEECSEDGGNSPDSGIGMSPFAKNNSSNEQDGADQTATHDPQVDSENIVYDLNDFEDATFETKNFESK